MCFYKIYHLGALDQIEATTFVEAKDDLEVLGKVGGMRQKKTVEVWDRTRRIGRVDPGLSQRGVDEMPVRSWY